MTSIGLVLYDLTPSFPPRHGTLIDKSVDSNNITGVIGVAVNDKIEDSIFTVLEALPSDSSEKVLAWNPVPHHQVVGSSGSLPYWVDSRPYDLYSQCRDRNLTCQFYLVRSVEEVDDLLHLLFDFWVEMERLYQILKGSPSSHDFTHMINVYHHGWRALKSEMDVKDDIRDAILLAALLHDADDRKLFPANTNYENAREILRLNASHHTEFIIYLISLVSSSKNGDNIPSHLEGHLLGCEEQLPFDERYLIPRYSDRLEALGQVGVERCLKYSQEVGMVSHTENTPRCSTEEELWAIATLERYRNYRGVSVSTIDHFYDKLLRLGTFPIANTYLTQEAERRTRPVIDFVLTYWTQH